MGKDNIAFAKPANAKWTVQRTAACVFHVRGPDLSVFATYDNLCQAEAKRGTLQRRDDLAARRQTRACMTCCTPFASEGIHNRMCPVCRNRNTDGWNPHGIAPKSGRPR